MTPSWLRVFNITTYLLSGLPPRGAMTFQDPPRLSLRLPWAMPEAMPVHEWAVAGEEYASRGRRLPLVASWTLVTIRRHFGSDVLLESIRHLDTNVHK